MKSMKVLNRVESGKDKGVKVKQENIATNREYISKVVEYCYHLLYKSQEKFNSDYHVKP